ncbi:MAG TPA: MTH1187 family thiamine-binding protein [Candidatus Kapabacteria bacterium]|nr:MTH1187 family thiamine-binding protein [Candidatus Kapabacteria bacterium]HPP40701.1 MTH1187 family thiamine-binding protein [Candidatus Kapabacteria bacterium]
MMVLAEFSMFPTDKGESVSAYVSQIIDFIDKSGITYKLTPMGTILEGSWEEVMNVISNCFKILEPQANRIYSTIKIDYRKGEESRMHSKINKIEKLLDKSVNK